MIVLDDHILMMESAQRAERGAVAALTVDSALHLPDSQLLTHA
jgi:hypothetical protein